ncbi:methylmalonyl-CoA mutase [Paenibacillus cellulosilyticus]|uniref:Fused isobutyryl-CoA mutase n=1 Tax=Paenibacillus cellulosilyticus TaxID=375489 RepID=A0A2V2YYN4_9BACL|nr:fused isobutyryl-CoA mutase/GTPase IcmF [Paenibacillus cellulosilyticus]PWW04842.1 methylmalonyl-CoA mutase [Paenibacillus cellulosilyticus]QKS45956.1 methylmalonyl-CoA mutase family protein [Paenibacillus cellulosilyticus]
MQTDVYRPSCYVRFVTAAALFDGHDASINIMRRILQSSGVEVVHLGHNRSAQEVVRTAIQEDVQGIAVSSYQGGHIEYLTYMYDLLQQEGAGHIRIFAGGGGVIIPAEIEHLRQRGIARVFSPEDGRRLGLQGMINEMIRACDHPTPKLAELDYAVLQTRNDGSIARLLSLAEERAARHALDAENEAVIEAITTTQDVHGTPAAPVIGITGTGGAGKSSLTDELVRRSIDQYPDRTIAILSVDPSKLKSGGALLGDRIRMNAVHHRNVYMRSLATRGSKSEISEALGDALAIVKRAGFDLILIETSGIGQGGAAIVDLCDVAVYVMTSEYGAASQLEKIDMIDYADAIVINKFERRGSEDALRDVRKQFKRSRQLFDAADADLPVFGTMASRFNDPGTTALFAKLMGIVEKKTGGSWPVLPANHEITETDSAVKAGETKHRHIIPPDRAGYLREIVLTVRQYRQQVEEQAVVVRELSFLKEAKRLLLAHCGEETATEEPQRQTTEKLDTLIAQYDARLLPEYRKRLTEWPAIREAYRQERLVTKVRTTETVTELYTESLSGNRIPRISLPRYTDDGDRLRWLMLDNLPGYFPYTAGVFPFKRTNEDPKRQFAGEGTPDRTNRRFHYLCMNDEAKRLSTAFDSVTLYGQDPDTRPDIYGKIGNSGVSISTLDDMKKLYAGFDLCHPSVSVSMTINGPAPMLLAMFMNTAIDQQVDRFAYANGRAPNSAEYEAIAAETLRTVRGTVQADILKEDQGQNTCIFSTEFALKMMGDIQQYFIEQGVRNYYSVSISGYHIAEAGANPITQLAFTLANGFTYVEYYLSRGMQIDDFAPNLSFFFSNGLDPEYSVMGRVARRIWATVMKHKYGANERSQKLKYHIQTSGRSLHAQEMDFNDIRTTLQALIAIYDNCNSLHTNAYDEAVTTPTESSVRRAMAIQLIINREFGMAKVENPLQGSFAVEELTDLVEEAVLQEFQRLHDRGGVLGAMETEYQRGRIQEESLYYEHKKHTGELPIIGVNTFINRDAQESLAEEMELARSTEEEKWTQINNLASFRQLHQQECARALDRLKLVAKSNGNVFEALMDTVRFASLGQITQALYEVGGQYRRNV